MKKTSIAVLVAVFAIATVISVMAADRGPQYYSASLPLGAGTVTPVATGGLGVFTPEYIVFAAPAGETQTISVVVGTITNAVGTKVIAAGDYIYAVSNVPPMFAGDKFKIASSVTTGTNSCKVIGNLND